MGTFPTAPLRTTHDRFRITSLASDSCATAQDHRSACIEWCVLNRQATSASVSPDTQYRCGVSHLAYLTVAAYRVTCPPSPCGRLSRPPGWGVTPTTTMGTP